MSWDFFDAAQPLQDAERSRAVEAIGLVFASEEGDRALKYLRRLTVERRLAPDAPEAALRDLEGQRRLVGLIESMVDQCRKG